MLQSDDLDAVWLLLTTGRLIFLFHCIAMLHRAAMPAVQKLYITASRVDFWVRLCRKKILSKVPTIDRGCKERQGLYVLRRTVMTAILVELAFIDNNDDLELLENDMPAFAGAIAAGIDEYFQAGGNMMNGKEFAKAQASIMNKKTKLVQLKDDRAEACKKNQ